MLEPGDAVTLKDDRDFRGRVLAVSGWGNVFLDVINWSRQTGGYRGRDGVLNKTRYPKSRLEKVEVKKEEGSMTDQARSERIPNVNCRCGRPAKYDCDGCDIGGPWCGYHCRLTWVSWIGKWMLQRLCPICRIEGRKEGFYDAAHFTPPSRRKEVSAL